MAGCARGGVAERRRRRRDRWGGGANEVTGHASGPDRSGKANGAGIAADPTLTGAWAPWSFAAIGRPIFTRSQGTLGARCLMLAVAEAPKSRLRQSASSPALAPASDLRLHRGPHISQHGAARRHLRAFSEAATACPYGQRSDRSHGGRGPCASSIAGRTGGLSSWNDFAHPSSLGLALGQSLLHAIAQDPRGQPPQRPLAWKPTTFQSLAA